MIGANVADSARSARAVGPPGAPQGWSSIPADRASAAERVDRHVQALCSVTPDRRPGSPGNHAATSYTASALEHAGWNVSFQDFDCIDWASTGATLTVGDRSVPVAPAPYGAGVRADGPVRIVHDLDDLAQVGAAAENAADPILVVTGALAAEPLTPRNYPFYTRDDHIQILDALEAAHPCAVLGVTGPHHVMSGAVDPFPLIEDGTFPFATANIRQRDAGPLLEWDGRTAHIEISSTRRAGTSRNVVATSGHRDGRVLVIAHLDSKPGTPGAVDNASGVAVLLLLAELLFDDDRDLPVGVELLAVNGEDHYAAPGELAWLAAHGDALDQIALVINIDGAGYRYGTPSYSTYNLDPDLAHHIDTVFSNHPTLAHGPAWYQSDHAIFAMNGRSALAVTSEPIAQIIEALFHSRADTVDEVDSDQLVEIAATLAGVIMTWPTSDRSECSR